MDDVYAIAVRMFLAVRRDISKAHYDQRIVVTNKICVFYNPDATQAERDLAVTTIAECLYPNKPRDQLPG